MWSTEELENLKRLLLSGIESNMLLAVEMLKQQEIPAEIEPLLCFLVVMEKENKNLRKILKALLLLSKSGKVEYWEKVCALHEKQNFNPAPKQGIVILYMAHFDLFDSYFAEAKHYLHNLNLSGTILSHSNIFIEQGLKMLERAAYHNPDDFKFNYDYAYLLPQTAEYIPLKIKHYKKCVELNSAKIAPFLRIVELYISIGDSDNVLKTIAENMIKIPEAALQLVNIASELDENGNALLSLKILEEIIKQDTNCARAHNNISFLLWSEFREYEKALAHILKAVELKPSRGIYWHTLAEVYYYGFGDKQKAEESITKGLKNEPNYNDWNELLNIIKNS